MIDAFNVRVHQEGTTLSTEINSSQATILKHLLVDGRKSCTQIAKESGLEKQTIYENYKKLKQAGIIKGATIHINYQSFGYKAVAYLLLAIDPSQADSFIEYIRKIPDIYSVFRIGPIGNIRIVATLKTLQQLDEIKDIIKQNFPIKDIKTVMWTDVKEMHENLTIEAPQSIKISTDNTIQQTNTLKPTGIYNKNKKIDKIDLQITEILSAKGREPFSKIAQKIGVTTNQVIKRYQNLKENGIVKATIQIDPTKIGYRALVVFFTAFTLQADSSSIIKRISQIPNVISIMKTSGDYDLQVYAMVKSIEQLLAIQEEFAKIPSIAKMDIDISKILDKWPTPKQYISTF
jgi:Lrp/AsnC family transcriptional regulator for asnA, asnC and gidA